MTITEARLKAKQRKALGAETFAGPHRSFPVPDHNHFVAALSRAHLAPNPRVLRRKAVAIGKRIGYLAQDYKATEAEETREASAAPDVAYEDRAQAIQRALEQEHSDGDGDGDDMYMSYTPCGQVSYVFPDYFIFCIGWSDKYFKRDYTIDDALAVTLGDVSTPVVRKITFLDAPECADDDDMDESDRADTGEQPLWEAGSRHNATDAQHIADADAHVGQAMHHMQHVQSHVAALGPSTPQNGVGSTYGAAGISLFQSAREAELTEAAVGENVAFREAQMATLESAAGAPKGNIRIRIIQPGFNSSGRRYYPKEAIAEAHRNKIFDGKQMFIDHPTVREEKERPERDVLKVGALLKETSLDADGNLWGDAAVVHPELKQMLANMQEAGVLGTAIGVSINATGKIREGEIEGRKTHVVEGFTEGKSVDFVTVPGAGGRISLLESHDGSARTPVAEGVRTVTPEQIQDLMDEMKAIREANATLTREVTESRQAADRANANAKVQSAVATRLAEFKEDDLPALAKKRVTLMFESADNTERLEEAIAAEVNYVKEIKASVPAAKGGTGVAGLGAKVTESGSDVIAPSRPVENSRLVEAMSRDLRGGEASAKDLLKRIGG